MFNALTGRFLGEAAGNHEITAHGTTHANLGKSLPTHNKQEVTLKLILT